MMAISVRSSAVVVAAIILMSASVTKAQTTCLITDPTASPVETWTFGVGSNESVTFTFTGGFTRHRIRIYDQTTPSVEYYSQMFFSHTASPNTNNIGVPRGISGKTVSAVVEVTLYDTMGTIVAQDSQVINLKTP